MSNDILNNISATTMMDKLKNTHVDHWRTQLDPEMVGVIDFGPIYRGVVEKICPEDISVNDVTSDIPGIIKREVCLDFDNSIALKMLETELLKTIYIEHQDKSNVVIMTTDPEVCYPLVRTMKHISYTNGGYGTKNIKMELFPKVVPIIPASFVNKHEEQYTHFYPAETNSISDCCCAYLYGFVANTPYNNLSTKATYVATKTIYGWAESMGHCAPSDMIALANLLDVYDKRIRSMKYGFPANVDKDAQIPMKSYAGFLSFARFDKYLDRCLPVIYSVLGEKSKSIISQYYLLLNELQNTETYNFSCDRLRELVASSENPDWIVLANLIDERTAGSNYTKRTISAVKLEKIVRVSVCKELGWTDTMIRKNISRTHLGCPTFGDALTIRLHLMEILTRDTLSM